MKFFGKIIMALFEQVNPYIYMCRCNNIEFNVFDGN